MNSRLDLEHQFADFIISVLNEDIRREGHATLLVSGGSTPQNLFEILSHQSIAWHKVNVIPVDERFVPDQHPDQNGFMVRRHLIKNHAAGAGFLPMVLDEHDSAKNLQLVRQQMRLLKKPFSLVILGMGEDGHTASLFPATAELDEGMDLNNEEDLIITRPSQAKHERITFTRRALLNARHVALHCYGEKKKKILDEVNKLEDYHTYPIEAFIHQNLVELKLFWAN